MSKDADGLSRRRYLATVAGLGSTGGLAGCSLVTGGTESTPTLPPSTCSNGGATGGGANAGATGGGANAGATDSRAKAGVTDSRANAGPWNGFYGDRLPRLGPGEYTGSKLTFVTADPRALRRYREVWEAAHGYLLYLKRTRGRTVAPRDGLERMTTVRPPGEAWSVYAAFHVPGDPAERRAWLAEFKLSKGKGVSIAEREERRGYTLYHVNKPAIRLVAVDDERILVVPDPEGAVSLDVESRFERLVATRRDETPPFHCHYRHARALVERVPPGDLTFAWLRTDDGTFGSGNVRVPDGARASAVTARLDWPGRGTGTDAAAPTDASRQSTPPTATSAQSTPPTATSARATPGDDGPDEPVVDLGLVTVFPDGEADVESVREHVREYRSGADGDGSTPLHFSDPSFERTGRVVTVTERRPLGVA